MSDRSDPSHRQTRYRALLILGPPGSGKGTQGAILDRVPGFCLVSMGEVLRELARQPEAGREARRIMEQGELLSAETAVAALQRHVERLPAARFAPVDDRLVLDGVPRDLDQARALERSFAVERLIELVADDESKLVRRLRGRGRADDREEQVIRRRLKVYRTVTLPLLKEYPAHRIHRVDALQSPLAVLRDVVTALLEPLAPAEPEESN